MRERSATRKEESNKVCAYFRPPSHPPTSTPSGPTHSTTRENICVGPTKRQEFYTDLGIKFNRRHGYTLLLYQQVNLITGIEQFHWCKHFKTIKRLLLILKLGFCPKAAEMCSFQKHRV